MTFPRFSSFCCLMHTGNAILDSQSIDDMLIDASVNLKRLDLFSNENEFFIPGLITFPQFSLISEKSE